MHVAHVLFICNSLFQADAEPEKKGIDKNTQKNQTKKKEGWRLHGTTFTWPFSF